MRNRSINTRTGLVPTHLSEVVEHHDHVLEKLLAKLPGRTFRSSIRWLRRPSSRWARLPAGFLLMGGGVLSILPFLGLWMLPLGLFLLAEDVPPLRRARGRALDWIARHRPHWLT